MCVDINEAFSISHFIIQSSSVLLIKNLCLSKSSILIEIIMNYLQYEARSDKGAHQPTGQTANQDSAIAHLYPLPSKETKSKPRMAWRQREIF
jgi:hypothetical protein